MGSGEFSNRKASCQHRIKKAIEQMDHIDCFESAETSGLKMKTQQFLLETSDKANPRSWGQQI